MNFGVNLDDGTIFIFADNFALQAPDDACSSSLSNS